MDQDAARELKLFTENDGDIYRQRTTPIVRNLRTKQAQGRYDHEKAVTLFMYLAEVGARKYAREHGDGEASWSRMFPRDVRLAVSREWCDEFEQESALGNYDNETYLPKKYLQAPPKKPSPPKKSPAYQRGLRDGIAAANKTGHAGSIQTMIRNLQNLGNTKQYELGYLRGLANVLDAMRGD